MRCNAASNYNTDCRFTLLEIALQALASRGSNVVDRWKGCQGYQLRTLIIARPVIQAPAQKSVNWKQEEADRRKLNRLSVWRVRAIMNLVADSV